MSDKTYATVAGFIQFDPVERDVNNQKVRDIAVKAIGSQKLVKITVWPDFKDVSLKKGDFIVADGQFSTKVSQKDDGSSVEYLNLSASTLLRLEPAQKAERAVVQGGGNAAAPSTKAPF